MEVNHKKKGITLIETIISLALIMILIIPISSMIVGVIKTGKNSTNKQQAVTLGQQITEEVKSLNSKEIVDRNGERYIYLTNGELKLKEEQSGYYKFIGENYNNSKFDLEVLFNKNMEQKSDSKINDIDMISIEDDTGLLVLKHKGEKKISLFDKLTIEVREENNKREITFYSGDISSGSTFILELEKSKNLTIKFMENNNSPLNIEIYNKGEESFNIYILQNKNSTTDININTIEGNVRKYKSTYNNSNDKDVEIGDLYDIDIKVIRNEEIIFNNDFKHNIILKGKK